MSGYWLIVAPVALAGMGALVVIARRLAYRPQHAAAYRGELADDWPAVGSMNLDDERAGRLGTWTPRPDPWPHGLSEWPRTRIDGRPLESVGWDDEDEGRPPWEPEPESLRCPTCNSPQPSMHPATAEGGEVCHICPDPYHLPAELPEQLARVFREQLGQVDQLEPADRLAEILGPLEPLPLEPAAPDAPWYDGAWLDGQLAALFAWVRAVRELA
jgi:hypothetical protein